MKNVKKIVAIVLMLSMIMLCGCGSDNSSNENSGNDNGSGSSGSGATSGPAIEKISPFKIKIDGKSYDINKEEGIAGYGEMPNVGAFPNGGVVREVKAGKITSEELEKDKVVNYANHHSFKGGIQTNNGYPLEARDLSLSISYRKAEKETNICGYSFTFVNSFEYMGINADSTAEEIKAAGFQPTSQKGLYYGIFSSKSVNYDELDKLLTELEDKPVTHADMVINPNEAFDFGVDYGAAVGLSGADEKNYDMGFGNYSKRSDKDTVRECIALGQQLSYLNNKDTDIVVWAMIYCTSEGNKGPLSDKNICYINVLTNKDYMMAWPEKWGWGK